MRELHGILYRDRDPLGLNLKQKYLLFDKFHIIDLDSLMNTLDPMSLPAVAELEFLQSEGIVEHRTGDIATLHSRHSELIWRHVADHGENEAIRQDLEANEWLVSCAMEKIAAELRSQDIDGVRIYQNEFRLGALSHGMSSLQSGFVLQVGLSVLPLPGEQCAWEDLIGFKRELHDKEWGFRRFLKILATKTQSESEVRDDIEWSLNEYENAMKINQLKASQSFVEVYLITPLEIIENLVKFNWSKIAKGALSVRKRKVELLEAEMKAPGRECAYVFDARKRFGAT